MNNTASELTEEHKAWLDKIRGWEKEFESFEEANGTISVSYEGKDVRKQVEHWQNTFIVQKQRLDQMKHNIKIYGGNVEKGKEELDEYESYLNELKDEFEAFRSQWTS